MFTIQWMIIDASFAQLGLKAGIGLSDIPFTSESSTQYFGYEIDYMDQRDPVPSYSFGIFYDLGIGNSWTFQPEVIYIRQGLKYNVQFLYASYSFSLVNNYIQSPILLKYEFGSGNQIRPTIFAGPYIAFLLHTDSRATYNESNLNVAEPQVGRFDVGLVGGAGLGIPFRRNQIDIGFRIGYGLVNVLERSKNYIPSEENPEEDKSANLSILLELGYRFGNKNGTE